MVCSLQTQRLRFIQTLEAQEAHLRFSACGSWTRRWWPAGCQARPPPWWRSTRRPRWRWPRRDGRSPPGPGCAPAVQAVALSSLTARTCQASLDTPLSPSLLCPAGALGTEHGAHLAAPQSPARERRLRVRYLKAVICCSRANDKVPKVVSTLHEGPFMSRNPPVGATPPACVSKNISQSRSLHLWLSLVGGHL